MADLCTTLDLALAVDGREDIQVFLPAGTRLTPTPDGYLQFVVACKSWFIPAHGAAGAPNTELRVAGLRADDKLNTKQSLAAILEPEHLGALIKGFDITKVELEDVAQAKKS
jgi:hypothetical protein